jgi:hypothetical protein
MLAYPAASNPAQKDARLQRASGEKDAQPRWVATLADRPE